MKQTETSCAQYNVWDKYFLMKHQKSVTSVYEGCSGSSLNLVIKCSNINILHSYFEILQVDIIELAPHS